MKSTKYIYTIIALRGNQQVSYNIIDKDGDLSYRQLKNRIMSKYNHLPDSIERVECMVYDV